MNIIDLSHVIKEDMPVYPGTAPPQIKAANTIEADGFVEKIISLYSHTGTHIDAPAHIIATGQTLDMLSIDAFIGAALCIEISQPKIDLAALKPFQHLITECDFLLFATGWSKYWGTDSYFKEYPVLTEEAARYLCDVNLKGVGFDTISADVEDSRDYPIHSILLEKMIIIENLTGIEVLANHRFLFSCLPLKLVDADGSPVRAVAILS